MFSLDLRQRRITSRRIAATLAIATLCTACVEFSPFEADLSEEDSDQNAKHLAQLADIPAPAGPLRFAVVSDSHHGFDGFTEAIKAINARDDISFVMHLGDMTQAGLRQDFRWTLDRLKRLDVPFVAALGNHDTLSNGQKVFRQMFGVYDYSFVYGGVRFVVYNGNQREFARPVPDLDWLSEVTAPTPDVTAVIVVGHQRPPNGSYETVLRDNGVSALITGHLHAFGVGGVVGVPAARVGTVGRRQWGLFTVDNGVVSAEFCVASRCEPVTL